MMWVRACDCEYVPMLTCTYPHIMMTEHGRDFLRYLKQHVLSKTKKTEKLGKKTNE